jgi:hypothetical protein
MSSVPVVAPLSSSIWVHTSGFTLPCTSSYQVTRTRDTYTLQWASVTEPWFSSSTSSATQKGRAKVLKSGSPSPMHKWRPGRLSSSLCTGAWCCPCAGLLHLCPARKALGIWVSPGHQGSRQGWVLWSPGHRPLGWAETLSSVGWPEAPLIGFSGRQNEAEACPGQHRGAQSWPCWAGYHEGQVRPREAAQSGWGHLGYRKAF